MQFHAAQADTEGEAAHSATIDASQAGGGTDADAFAKGGNDFNLLFAGRLFTKLILRVEGTAFGETLANQPCKAYICRIVIRFGLIPGAVDRGRCGCNQSGPTKFDPWQPRRDSDPDLSACKSECPTVRPQGSIEADCRAVAFLSEG